MVGIVFDRMLMGKREILANISSLKNLTMEVEVLKRELELLETRISMDRLVSEIAEICESGQRLYHFRWY